MREDGYMLNQEIKNNEGRNLLLFNKFRHSIHIIVSKITNFNDIIQYKCQNNGDNYNKDE